MMWYIIKYLDKKLDFYNNIGTTRILHKILYIFNLYFFWVYQIWLVEFPNTLYENHLARWNRVLKTIFTIIISSFMSIIFHIPRKIFFISINDNIQGFFEKEFIYNLKRISWHKWKHLFNRIKSQILFLFSSTFKFIFIEFSEIININQASI